MTRNASANPKAKVGSRVQGSIMVREVGTTNLSVTDKRVVVLNVHWHKKSSQMTGSGGK